MTVKTDERINNVSDAIEEIERHIRNANFVGSPYANGISLTSLETALAVMKDNFPPAYEE